MSDDERWSRRRKDWWFDIYEEFERMNKMIDDIVRRSFRFEPERIFEGIEPGESKVYTYGFSIRVGPDGKPVIREFGNVFPGRYGPEVKSEIEPLVDVIEKEDEIIVVAELPGVEKEQIQVNATEKSLTIRVDAPDRRYRKELELPDTIDPKSSKATYKNGVLEVKLKKTGQTVKGEKLKIE
ncbi:MAG: archaeal heat shock protein Hsp20 [Candidatus Bathyarchaeia archaeon]